MGILGFFLGTPSGRGVVPHPPPRYRWSCAKTLAGTAGTVSLFASLVGQRQVACFCVKLTVQTAYAVGCRFESHGERTRHLPSTHTCPGDKGKLGRGHGRTTNATTEWLTGMPRGCACIACLTQHKGPKTFVERGPTPCLPVFRRAVGTASPYVSSILCTQYARGWPPPTPTRSGCRASPCTRIPIPYPRNPSPKNNCWFLASWVIKSTMRPQRPVAAPHRCRTYRHAVPVRLLHSLKHSLKPCNTWGRP